MPENTWPRCVSNLRLDLIHINVSACNISILERWERMDESTFDACWTHDFSNQNKVSPVLFFLMKKSGLHIIFSFYVPTSPTYICTSSVDVQLYIRKYLPFCKHRKRLLYIRSSRDLETQRGHIFSGNTFARNLNSPRI